MKLDRSSSIVGYRFHPTHEELIDHYLKKKRLDPNFPVNKIKEVKLYDYEPSALPGLSPAPVDDAEWYFFCVRDMYRKRVNRKTRGGKWKVTGNKRDIKDKHKNVIGWKIILVFYAGSGNAKKVRTNWVMHEFHITDQSDFKEDYVVVRIKRNPSVKHQAPVTSNGDTLTPDRASNSGNHNSDEDALQDEGQLQYDDISGGRISQLLPKHSLSDYREIQLQPNDMDNGMIFTPNDVGQEGPMTFAPNDFCQAGSMTFAPNGSDHGTLTPSDIDHEGSTTLTPNDIDLCTQEYRPAHSQMEQVGNVRGSPLAFESGQETGNSPFFKSSSLFAGDSVYSEPSVASSSLYFERFEPSDLLAGDSVDFEYHETLATLLSDFDCESQFLPPEENILPVQMGSIV